MAQDPKRVNPPVEDEVDYFPLNGGLDLTSSKILAEKGTLLDCSNRETVDRIGYKTIDGFDRYDGRTPSTQNEFYYISADSYSGTLATDFAAGSLLIVEDDITTLFGKVVTTTTISSKPTIVYARISEDAEPAVGQVVNKYTTTTPDFTVSVGPTRWSSQTSETAREVVDSYNTYNATLRSDITDLHDIPIGLHWYRDKLYAVVDDATVYFTQASGTSEIIANSLLSKDAGASTARVLDIQLASSGTWAGGNAAGTMQIEVLTGTWATSGTVSVTAPTNTTTVTLRAAASTDPEPKYASLWRSRSEQQSIDDVGNTASTGWTRIDHGWEVDYEDGLSDTGGFTIVQRGVDNNFSYTSSSATGFPVTVINGNNVVGSSFATNSITPITSARVDNGDAGWKTNASSTVFAGSAALDTALSSADANYAYANVWYYGAGSLISFGFTAGALAAFDKSIYGPVTTFNSRSAPSTIGTETFDSDFFSTQARAPLLLQDFSSIAASIPDGSLIVGCEVVVSYSAQNYAEGTFQADRNGTNGANIVTNTIDWVKNNLVWEAGFVRSTTATECTLLGTAQTAALTINTTPGDYQSSITSSATRDVFAMAKTITGQTATIGGSTNTFGQSGLTRTDLLDTSLGIALYAQVSGAPTYPLSPPMINYSGTSTSEYVLGVVRLKVDRIQVKMYYSTPSARYYVGDGTAAPANVCSVDVTYYVNRDGTFSAGTAEGSVQFTNIQAVTGSKRTVEVGDKFYLTQSDAENSSGPVATVVTADAEYNGLPAKNLLIDEASRYEFITANFFGRDEWDGFYGVSGAGRAFSFATYDADNDGDDEDYVIKVTTSTLDEAGDKPRHIAFHHYALALGFRSGIVRLSVPGEPENFDGVSGAAEVGVGDKITGLLSMRGETLGVFCENSIWGIAGTDADAYQTQVLAPYTGAIEYTVVDMGLPVYCDSRGISTLDQSEKYGNFLGRRLSSIVTPWILPRMIRNNAQFSGKGVVCAIPVRAKNQYRLFFKDGKCLVMTMNPDAAPSFTFSDYYIGQSAVTETSKFLVPFAWSSQVDDKGVERVHFSHYSPLSSVSAANSLYVYEMDQGWSFAGNFIPASYTINWYYKDPFRYSTIRKLRLDGLTSGTGSCKVYLAKEYDTTFSTASVDISLPRNTLSSYYVDPVPATNLANLAERGRNLTFKVVNEIPSGDTITDPIPADIHQIAMVQFQAGGLPDA